MDSNKHLVNYIIGYFKNLNIQINTTNHQQMIPVWFEISNDLINLIPDISLNSIKKYKESYEDLDFIDIINSEFINNKTSENLVNCQLNELYKGSIVECKRIELTKLYPNIFKKLWINNIITLEDEKLGIILSNIIDKFDYIAEVLTLHNKKTYLNFYVNFLYYVFATKKLKYKLNCDCQIQTDIISKYSSFLMECFVTKFSKYVVYHDIDVIHILDVNEPDNNNSEIFNFFQKYIFDNNSSISIKNNVISLFLGRKKYLYFYNNSVKYVGIKRIDPNDKNAMLKHARNVKLNKIFEE